MARTYTELKSFTFPIADLKVKVAKSQIVWIDNARIISCFFAVFLHTSAGVVSGIADTGSSEWWMGTILNSFARWSMPIFIMISGALLLDPTKNEPIGLFYKKRISRIFIPLIAWTLFYLFFQYFGKLAISGEHTPILHLVGSVMYGLPYYHLWYLYMVVGLYLFVPFLGRIVRNSSYNELLVLCAALFVFSMLGNAFVSYFVSSHIPAFFTFIYYLPYFLAGYLIVRTKYEPPAWLLWITFIVFGLLNGLCYYLTLGANGSSNGYFFNTLCITIVPMSISMMFLLKRSNMSFVTPAAGSKIALLSLGIYLVHPFFLDTLNYFGISGRLFLPVISIPLLALVAFALSLSASFMLSKIPWLKKTIGLY